VRPDKAKSAMTETEWDGARRPETVLLGAVLGFLRCEQASKPPARERGEPTKAPPAPLPISDQPTMGLVQVSDGAPEALEAPSMALVKRHREQILEIATALGVSNIRIFGSVARGDATADSDIDLLVDFDRGHHGLDLFRFERRVEELLRHPVEVGTEVDELIRAKVESQAVPL
jgi:predicted nucleotidyltransferase